MEKRRSFLVVDGRVVTLSFTPVPNEVISDRLRQMLIASYEDNGTFANSNGGDYDNGGETDAP